jgi:hypothetical protein
MHAALREMLTDTITVAPVLSRDAYGVTTYGPAVSRPARIQRRMLTLFGATGRQIVPSTKIVLDGDVPISDMDQITLDDGTQPPIQGIETYTDEQGNLDHYTVLL